MSHSTPENNMYVRNDCLHIMHTGDDKITDITGMQHHLHHHTKTMSSDNFTTGGSTRQGNWFHNIYPCEYSNDVFHACNSMENKQQMPQDSGSTPVEGSSLASVMVKQTILQAALTSIEMFDGTKGKFKAWTEAVKM